MSEARNDLAALLDKVEAGEEITVTRHGRPIAVVIQYDRARRRRAEPLLEQGARRRAERERARSRPLPKPSISAEHAELWVNEIRADRDDR
jgi:prevent-host-death family protein